MGGIRAITLSNKVFPYPREWNGDSYSISFCIRLVWVWVSVPSRGDWWFLTRYMSKLQFNRKRFPSPLEVIGGYYQRVILRMRKTTLCFRTLPRWMEVLTESRLLKGWKKFRFPSPLEVTEAFYLSVWYTSVFKQSVAVPSRGDWGFLQVVLKLMTNT